MSGSRTRRHEVALTAARAGASVADERFRTAIAVERKGAKTDVVTEADREAQAAVAATIAEAFPGEPIVGEEDEEPSKVPAEGPAWIVDPIDGTHNYVRAIPTFATAVAAVVDAEPVAASIVLPALGDVYHAGSDGVVRNGEPIAVVERTDPEECTACPLIWWPMDRREEYAAATRAIVTRFGDLHRMGCAQATLATIAAGGIDAAFTNVDANPWDTVAGVHLIREAGGTVTDLAGDPWRHDGDGLVASSGPLHGTVLEAAREVEAARDAVGDGD